MSFFHFEADFVDSLRCIPMIVRYKLDTSGVKLKLHHWNQLSEEERRSLVELPCDTENDIQTYRHTIHQFVDSHGSDRPSDLPVEPQPEWDNATQIPASVEEKAQEMGVHLSIEQWTQLTPIERFALIKLSRSNHENKNFIPALKEFQLI